MRYLIAFPFLFCAHGAAAQERTLTLDGDTRFLRCTDLSGTASCELLYSDDADDMYQCIAFDPDGEPIAATAVFSGMPVMFRDLSATDIADVACKAS